MEYTVKVDKEGTVKYYKPGTDVLHREDGPAVVWTRGNKAWYKEGKYHREGGPAIEYSDGAEAWYIDGKRHREDGPAFIEPNGHEAWYKEGNRHREDGPALEYANGRKEWYIEGEWLSKNQFEKRTKEAKVRTFTVPANTTQIRIQLD
jgi:hypothetical protein